MVTSPSSIAGSLPRGAFCTKEVLRRRHEVHPFQLVRDFELFEKPENPHGACHGREVELDHGSVPSDLGLNVAAYR